MEESRAYRFERVLISLALLLLAARFLWPGDTVYILDEAFIQLRIDEHFAAGTIPLSNSRGSSIPVPYGPGAQWLFMFLRLFSWHPIFFAIVHLLAQLLGALLFFRTLRRAYGPEAAAWCALLVASSPLLFFFSRHIWDNTFFIPLAALSLWLLQRLRENGPELLIHVLLGLVTGYCVNIHLMYGPIALALGFTLILINLGRHGVRSRNFWLLPAAFGISALIVLAPYLIELARIAKEERPMDHARVMERWGDGRNLWWLFMRTTLFSSLYGANVSFDQVKNHFLDFSGPFFAYFFRIDMFGWFAKLAAWGSAVVVLARLVRGRIDSDPLRLFAALSFAGVLIVYQYLNIPTAPHYFNPIWWFVFIGMAGAIVKLQGWGKKFFLFTLACTAAVNISYISFATAYIHVNRGARNMETSVVVSEQLRMFRELCAWGRARGIGEVKIFKEAIMGEPAFEFLPAHMPECAGTKLVLVPSISLAHLRLYQPAESATSAALLMGPGELR